MWDRTSNERFAENGKVSGKKASVSTCIECHQGSVYLYDKNIKLGMELIKQNERACLDLPGAAKDKTQMYVLNPALGKKDINTW